MLSSGVYWLSEVRSLAGVSSEVSRRNCGPTVYGFRRKPE